MRKFTAATDGKIKKSGKVQCPAREIVSQIVCIDAKRTSRCSHKVVQQICSLLSCQSPAQQRYWETYVNDYTFVTLRTTKLIMATTIDREIVLVYFHRDEER